jgi:hypothetical protein
MITPANLTRSNAKQSHQPTFGNNATEWLNDFIVLQIQPRGPLAQIQTGNTI